VLIRLLTFSSGAPGEVTDQFVRQTLLPELVGRPGLRHAYVGRAGGDPGRRVVLSVWAGHDRGDLGEQQPWETGAVIGEARVELYPASVALNFATPDGAQIMRVFRGQSKEGRSAEYLDAVRDGTLADVAAGRGPVALFLGMIDDHRFVTASIWPDWERIQAATGGNIRQPIATRHRDLLIEGDAEHYEIVPNTMVLPAAADSPAELAGPGAGHSG
jgi:hypothetical protein